MMLVGYLWSTLMLLSCVTARTRLPEVSSVEFTDAVRRTHLLEAHPTGSGRVEFSGRFPHSIHFVASAASTFFQGTPAVHRVDATTLRLDYTLSQQREGETRVTLKGYREGTNATVYTHRFSLGVAHRATSGISKPAHTSPEVRTLPTIPVTTVQQPVDDDNPSRSSRWTTQLPRSSPQADGKVKPQSSSVGSLARVMGRDGAGAEAATETMPGNPVGAIGPNHYVQAANTQYIVMDKAGVVLGGPFLLGTLWTGSGLGGGACENNGGNPTVAYDRMADRWVLTQVHSNDGLCVAVSQTADPLGAYHLYDFAGVAVPGHPRLGVWSHAYFLSTSEDAQDGPGGSSVWALERQPMLMGGVAKFVRRSYSPQADSFNFCQPADLDGAMAPPMGNPGYCYSIPTGAGGAIQLFEIRVNWADTTGWDVVKVGEWPAPAPEGPECDDGRCGRQPNDDPPLDVAASRPGRRLVYRRFDTREVLLGAFFSRPGVAWFHLQREFANETFDHAQGGKVAPMDGQVRFLPSLAMDGDGNIAMTYTLTSEGRSASMVLTGRMAGDPMGEMSLPEFVVRTSWTSLLTNHLSDTSSMNVDPTDDATFWATGPIVGFAGRWASQIEVVKLQADPVYPTLLALPTAIHIPEGESSVVLTLSDYAGPGISAPTLNWAAACCPRTVLLAVLAGSVTITATTSEVMEYVTFIARDAEGDAAFSTPVIIGRGFNPQPMATFLSGPSVTPLARNAEKNVTVAYHAHEVAEVTFFTGVPGLTLVAQPSRSVDLGVREFVITINTGITLPLGMSDVTVMLSIQGTIVNSTFQVNNVDAIPTIATVDNHRTTFQISGSTTMVQGRLMMTGEPPSSGVRQDIVARSITTTLSNATVTIMEDGMEEMDGRMLPVYMWKAVIEDPSMVMEGDVVITATDTAALSNQVTFRVSYRPDPCMVGDIQCHAQCVPGWPCDGVPQCSYGWDEDEMECGDDHEFLACDLADDEVDADSFQDGMCDRKLNCSLFMCDGGDCASATCAPEKVTSASFFIHTNETAGSLLADTRATRARISLGLVSLQTGITWDMITIEVIPEDLPPPATQRAWIYVTITSRWRMAGAVVSGVIGDPTGLAVVFPALLSVDAELPGVRPPFATLQYEWLTWTPSSAVVDEKVTFRFVGYRLHTDPVVKVVPRLVSCSDPSAMEATVRGGTLDYTTSTAGEYNICLKILDVWQRLPGVITVSLPDPTAPFGSYQTCAGYVKAMQATTPLACGCYETAESPQYTAVLPVDLPFGSFRAETQGIRVNQGCCGAGSQDLTPELRMGICVDTR